MDPRLPPVSELTSLQLETTERWHQQPIENPYEGFAALVCRQHAFNFRLWHEEDKAREPGADDVAIAGVKREIDRLNQARNDAIEMLDQWIADQLEAAGVQAESAPRNTETPGSAIDRLSILSLRLYHYREQQHRTDTDEAHRSKVQHRIAICEHQHAELSLALQQLLDDLAAGRKKHQLYRQLKMYNDPTLNPAIYNPGHNP